MNLPVKSLDNLIFEALIQNSSLAAISINESINKTFNDIASDIDLIRLPEDGAHNNFYLMNEINLSTISRCFGRFK